MPATALEFTFSTIDPPGSMFTFSFAINPKGDIVGWYIDASGANHGSLLNKGVFKTIDFPGATATTIDGIKPKDYIVGTYVAGGVTHGFLAQK
jgi:hypothetical protein